MYIQRSSSSASDWQDIVLGILYDLKKVTSISANMAVDHLLKMEQIDYN